MSPKPPRPSTPARHRFWRPLFYQGLAIAAVLALLAFLVANTAANMARQGIPGGFDFLLQPAGFNIGEGGFPFVAGDPYWQAFAAGLANTLRVALLAILLTTLLGTALGVGSQSRNFLLRSLCTAYVELFRNVPLLLQLLAWYIFLVETLPPLEQAWQLGALFVSKGGLSFPFPAWHDGAWQMEWPARGAFAIGGGASLTPEFLAVLFGLTFYSAAYLAETVRGGIEAVARGQAEAAAALGLNRRQTLRRVILPQALRVIIPSATNQYLSLIKNSSLAISVGYPDLVSIANTSLNQTGRAVECIALIMAVYLGLSLVAAALLGWLNRRAALRER
ncbi:MAG: ABC transporter permease subunit [Betaproteobacteria bacterium]